MSSRTAAKQKRLVRRLLSQRTYPELLGLDVEKEGDWFPWLVASSLFAKPISAGVARRTAGLLFLEGVRSPESVRRRGWEGLVAILDAGGYVRYDFSTADKLLEIAAALPGDALQSLGSSASSADEVAKRLMQIRGIGPKTVSIFLRELRGVWRFDVPISGEAGMAARRLGIDLRKVRLSGGELSRLESVLVRVWVEHCKRGRWQTCPAGGDCGCSPERP